jgi:hypothetical protein
MGQHEPGHYRPARAALYLPCQHRGVGCPSFSALSKARVETLKARMDNTCLQPTPMSHWSLPDGPLFLKLTMSKGELLPLLRPRAAPHSHVQSPSPAAWISI